MVLPPSVMVFLNFALALNLMILGKPRQKTTLSFGHCSFGGERGEGNFDFVRRVLRFARMHCGTNMYR